MFKHVDFLVCFDGDVLLLAFLVVFEKEKNIYSLQDPLMVSTAC